MFFTSLSAIVILFNFFLQMLMHFKPFHNFMSFQTSTSVCSRPVSMVPVQIWLDRSSVAVSPGGQEHFVI